MNNHGDKKEDSGDQRYDHLPGDLRQAELQNIKQAEQDLGVEEEPVQQHLEKPKRYRVPKTRQPGK